MSYLFLGFILSILSFFEIIAKDKRVFKIIWFFLIVFMVLFVGFRDGTIVGTDSPAYFRYYIEKLPPVELGYKYINYLFSDIGLSYTLFLLFINLISLFNVGRFIKLNSFYLIFPLFIYFSDFYFYYNFSGIRQALALSFVALSVYYIFKDKKLISLLLILIASLFHVTALIFILAFFVPKVRMELSKYIKFLLIVIIGVLVGSYIIENVPYLNYRFVYYSSMQEQSDNIVGNYLIGILKRSIVLFAVLLVFKDFFKENKNFYLYNLYVVGFIIYVSSYLISPEFGVRLGSYFVILDCILISSYIYYSKSFTNRMVYFILFTLIAFYKIYTYTLISAYDYKFF